MGTGTIVMPARALMVLGTASNVGKSLIAAALCRHFAARGVRVAPFKAQNMSLNSCATPDGGEIGRAQALQAEAAGIVPSTDMNPVLLKPTSDTGSQVVLQGRVFGTYSAREYRAQMRHEIWNRVLESYRRLSERYELIVVEGAGSPAEINLRETDIANMEMAHAANARCLLVADIDRGGAFASLLGTVQLLDARDRSRIAAFAINKFRGDAGLLTPGIAAIEPLMGLPCAGVIPHIRDIGLDDEDSVTLERGRERRAWHADGAQSILRVAVVMLPYISNFTDFNALEAEPSVDLRYIRRPEDLEDAHVVIVPGTKSTISDLRWLKDSGIAAALADGTRRLVFGVCGGLQMLGSHVDDPFGVEGGGSIAGLGLLPVRTVLGREKITVPVIGQLTAASLFGVAVDQTRLHGYEIHLGESSYGECDPFATIQRSGRNNSRRDGAVSGDGRVVGTYLHGIFNDDEFRHLFVQAARTASGLPLTRALAFVEREREKRLDRLAVSVCGALDLELFA
jgi:adenosylcobyric acid synthase